MRTDSLRTDALRTDGLGTDTPGADRSKMDRSRTDGSGADRLVMDTLGTGALRGQSRPDDAPRGGTPDGGTWDGQTPDDQTWDGGTDGEPWRTTLAALRAEADAMSSSAPLTAVRAGGSGPSRRMRRLSGVGGTTSVRPGYGVRSGCGIRSGYRGWAGCGTGTGCGIRSGYHDWTRCGTGTGCHIQTGDCARPANRIQRAAGHPSPCPRVAVPLLLFAPCGCGGDIVCAGPFLMALRAVCGQLPPSCFARKDTDERPDASETPDSAATPDIPSVSCPATVTTARAPKKTPSRRTVPLDETTTRTTTPPDIPSVSRPATATTARTPKRTASRRAVPLDEPSVPCPRKGGALVSDDDCFYCATRKGCDRGGRERGRK